ncbi:hypothetical protein ACU4GG_13925 [Streptomyces nojiriensis]
MAPRGRRGPAERPGDGGRLRRAAPRVRHHHEVGPGLDPAHPDRPLVGPFETGLPATTVPLTAVPDGAGVRLYFRRPDSGVVRTALVTATSGKPQVSSVAEAGGRAGYGAVGVAGRLVSGRADTGTISTTGLGGPPAWTESAMLYAGAPGAVLELSGTTTAVLGLDANLHITTTPRTPTTPTWHRAVR